MDTHYEILGLESDATPDEIKRAFRQLALKYHPDQHPTPIAATLFRRINEAYEVLSDPVRREAYDLSLRGDARGRGPRHQSRRSAESQRREEAARRARQAKETKAREARAAEREREAREREARAAEREREAREREARAAEREREARERAEAAEREARARAEAAEHEARARAQAAARAQVGARARAATRAQLLEERELEARKASAQQEARRMRAEGAARRDYADRRDAAARRNAERVARTPEGVEANVLFAAATERLEREAAEQARARKRALIWRVALSVIVGAAIAVLLAKLFGDNVSAGAFFGDVL
ncbi:MAG: J domain-containing protein [Myxococcales bacterium]|nr:J domain-containing protein [Myxococcales bacterium]